MAVDNEIRIDPMTIVNEHQPHDWIEFWFVFLANAWIIAAVTAVFFTVSAFYFFSLPSYYTATTTILAEQPEANTPQSQMVIPSVSQDEEGFGTQLAILRGSNTEQAVLSELGENVSGYKIDARHIRGTRILSLSVTHHKPELAAQIANKFAEVYVRESKHENAFIGQQILKLLPGNTDKATSTSSSTELPKSLNKQEFASSSAEVPQSFNKQEFASSLTSISNDNQIQQLKSQKLELHSRLIEYSQRYKEEHPVIKDLNKRLSAIEDEIKTRSETILNNVKANLGGELNITNIRVLEEAEVPGSPSGPDRFRGIFTGTLVGFLGAVFFFFFLEQFNQKVRVENDLVAIGISFLGYIPLAVEFIAGQKYRGVPPEPDVAAALNTNIALADAVASARTHILFSIPYEKSRRIMLTSSIPGEGKSTVAALLSISLTTLGRKILLIDSDLRKPSVHRYLGLRNDKGLSDYLGGSSTLDEIIQFKKDGLLGVITAGTIPHNPSELLASDRFRELLDKCAERFDRIVVDVPPVLYIPDGLIIAKIVHTGILTCGANMVQKKIIKHVKEKFDSVGCSFIGAVINRADFEKDGHRYKYYSAYKSYYTTPHRQPVTDKKISVHK